MGCDFNRSMQHLNSHRREGGDANEVPNEDLLHRRTKDSDVGSLAGGPVLRANEFGFH